VKIILEMELKKADLEELCDEKTTQKELKEELIDRLFDVCEDWVLRGQQPDFKFEM